MLRVWSARLNEASPANPVRLAHWSASACRPVGWHGVPDRSTQGGCMARLNPVAIQGLHQVGGQHVMAETQTLTLYFFMHEALTCFWSITPYPVVNSTEATLSQRRDTVPVPGE